MTKLHVIFYGRVHGVGFRATAERLAISLSISGFVRNNPDGSVEIEAYGEKKSLSLFLKNIQEIFSKKIERIESTFMEGVLSPFSSFEIQI